MYIRGLKQTFPDMKRLFILFITLLVFGALNAQETYRFHTDHPQGFSIENSTKSALSLHYSIAELGITNVERDGAKGQEIILEGCFAPNAEGLPNLPFVNQFIAVPRGAKVSIEVKEKACQTLQNIELLPAAPLLMNNEDKRPALHWDMSVFGKDVNYPTESVTIAQTTQIRGLDVVMLNVTPFRYNPVQKTLEVIYDIDIKVHFEGSNGQFGDTRYRNPAWDNILHDLVINSDMLPEVDYYEHLNEAIRNREEGCEYLIFAPDDSVFMVWADTLKQFRMRQGILTKVVTTAECGNEPEEIRNYILNAYENWAIPPAAVLMFGGNQRHHPDFGIKPFIHTMPKESGEVYHYPTDNPFADMNGDSIPDIAISRIVAYDANECQTLVKKCIEYELNPPTDAHYYDHPIITSGYEEDKWFMITSQITNSFICNKLEKHPTNLYMKYYWVDDDPTPPESLWSTDEYTAAALDYFGPNGTNYIPSTLGGLDQWIDEFYDDQMLIDAINEDGFLTFFRDHSNRELWACPLFGLTQIRELQNKQPTFVFSIGCLTNDYWNCEGNGFSELFCKTGAGAIGILGANSVTYSHYNDLITWGMVDYFWPDFMPTLGSQTQPDFVYPAFSLVAGKVYFYQQSFRPFWTEGIHRTLNLFSFLGDTYLNLYTEVPQRMDISIAPYQTEDQREITFPIEENALVCIARDGEILHVAQGTGQPMTFALPVMQPGQQYQVTVTKQNRIRYQQDVTIVPSTGPYMVMENYCFHDENSNGLLEYNETASIDLMLYNAGVGAAENTEITLLCESPYVEITQGTAICANLLPDRHKTLHNALRIYIMHDIPDQTLLTFKLILDNGINTQEIEFEQNVAAPILNISPSFQLFTGNNEPSLHLTDTVTYLTATISNTGHAKSEPVDAKVNIKAPFVSVERLNDTIDGLEGGETRAFTFKINAVTNEIEEAWLQTHIGFQSGQNLMFLDTILPYGGVHETFESDTLNPLFTWQNDNNYPWDYYSGDAAEGDRCFMTSLPRGKSNTLKINMNGRILPHNAVMSLYIKDEGWAGLSFIEKLPSGNQTQSYSNTTGWTYVKPIYYAGCQMVTIGLHQNSMVNYEYKIDNIYFPPMHSTIAYTGDEVIACTETPIELNEAYAYDCNSVLWSTEGDGHFDNDTITNPTYFPGNQDIANGNVTLILTAFGNDTIISTTQIRFVDEINLGAIVGDSVVNKYEQTVSHYSIDNQEGVHYIWQLEPAEAGVIYEHGNEIDILWDLHKDDMEATLSVTAENGCSVEPITKRISLIGYSTAEWIVLHFEVYPNPTDGKINLVVDETLQGKAVVEVYNLLGERMMTQKVGRLQKGEALSLDLGGLVSGLYIIKLSTENGSCSRKVSVK